MPTKSPKSSLSLKPYDGFPLTPHQRSNQWCKKIRGRIIYFGSLDNPDAALEKYLLERDEWQAGRNPREKMKSATLEELCNQFLEDKATKVKTGEMTSRTHSDYNRTCQIMCDHVGKTRSVESFTDEALKSIRTKFATLENGKPAGLVTLMNHMRRVRSLFYFALEKEWLPKTIKQPQLRKLLEIPSKKSRRIERNIKGPRTFEASEIRKILISASLQMRAMALLGINCALGQTDISALPETALNLDDGWLDYPRVKTGIQRRIPLWPETVAAIRDVLAKRKKPKDTANSGLVFITQQGHTFIGTSEEGTHIDSAGLTFSRLLRRLKIHRPGIGFYTLRHMVESVGGETEAQVAVDHILGHSPDDDDMSAEYREFIKDERLKRVTDHVRLWLWQEGSEAAWIKAESKRIDKDKENALQVEPVKRPIKANA